MDRKLGGGILIFLGAVLLVLAALADPIGLGQGGGIGWQQTAGMIVGAVVIVVGLALMFVQRGEAKTPQPLT